MRLTFNPRQRDEANTYFFLVFCVSADAAAVLASLLDFGSFSTLAAADADLALVVSLLFDWVNAAAAAVFESLLAFGSFRTLAAAAAAFGLVCSEAGFLAIRWISLNAALHEDTQPKR
jgi:hypothetical protein